MAQQWEGLLEGAAQELKGHLTLERVTASKAGDEIAVFFSSDMLVEEKPFLAAQRAIRRNFAPTRVKLIIRSPQLAQDFLNDPQKYAPFILRCVKRRHPSGAPFMNDAALECKGDVLSVLVPQDIAPKFLEKLEHAEGYYDTVCGKLSVSWKRDGDAVILNVTVPEGIYGTIKLPFGWRFENTDHAFRPLETVSVRVKSL